MVKSELYMYADQPVPYTLYSKLLKDLKVLHDAASVVLRVTSKNGMVTRKLEQCNHYLNF